jgi:hypothetical protein
MAPATLLIEPASQIPVKELVSFAYQGDGKDLHLFPLKGNPADMTFEVWHFSGYGTGQGQAGDLGKFLPGSGESNAEAKGAAMMDSIWLNHGGVPSADDKEKVCDVLLEWYDTSVIGDLKIAETDSGQLPSAGAQYMRWKYQVQLWCEPIPETKVVTADKSLARGLQHAYKEVAPPVCDCRQMVKWSKEAEINLLVPYAPELEYNPNVRDDLKNCQKFEIEVSGKITRQGPIGPTSFSVQKGTIPLKQSGTTFQGSADLAGGFEVPDPECSYSPLTWHITVNVEAPNELVSKGWPLDVNVTLALQAPATGTCDDVTRALTGMTTIPVEPFQIPAYEGAEYHWANKGFPEGEIVFTLRDPNSFLDQIGKWSGD